MPKYFYNLQFWCPDCTLWLAQRHYPSWNPPFVCFLCPGGFTKHHPSEPGGRTVYRERGADFSFPHSAMICFLGGIAAAWPQWQQLFQSRDLCLVAAVTLAQQTAAMSKFKMLCAILFAQRLWPLYLNSLVHNSWFRIPFQHFRIHTPFSEMQSSEVLYWLWQSSSFMLTGLFSSSKAFKLHKYIRCDEALWRSKCSKL